MKNFLAKTVILAIMDTWISLSRNKTGVCFRKKGGKTMALKSEYMKEIYKKVCQRDQGEPEFLQAVQEVLE